MQGERKDDTGGSQKLIILLIDDMKSLALLLQAGLQQRGHTVFAAFSGREGIEIFEKELPDVIICDMGMEEMNGLEVSQAMGEICEQKEIPTRPFILLTGWGAAMAEEALSHTGVDRVIAKPVEVAALAQMVQEVVGNT
jgi:CheY-like chemotaxis protein